MTTIAPLFPLSASSNGVTPVEDPAVGGTATPFETLSIFDMGSGSIFSEFGPPSLIGTTVADVNGNWSFQPSGSLGYSGTYVIYVYDGAPSAAKFAALTTISLQASSTVLNDYLNIVGRPADQQYLGLDEAALSNGTLTASALASSLAASQEAQNAVGKLYTTELGRTADVPGATAATQYLATGGSLTSLATSLAASSEAQADIITDYQNELGRAPDTAGAAAFTKYLGTGGSLTGVAFSLANSSEAQADLATIFQNELGRAPDATGLASFTQALANGSSLAAIRASVAASPESQAAVNYLYGNVLGRQADAAGQAGITQFLSNGGTLTGVRAAFASSPEVAADINSGYTAALGHAANPVEIAAGESELLSGGSLASLQSEIAAVGSSTPQPTPVIPSITPEVLGSNPPAFISSLGSNDALIASSANDHVSVGMIDTITGFNAATDVIEVQASQASGFGALQIQSNASGSSDAFFLGRQDVLINNATGPLTAANFRFVS